MKQEQLEIALGRSLTSKEVSAIEQYGKMAQESLQNLLGYSLESEVSDRYFTGREGYATTFTGIFSQINSVTIDGEAVPSDDFYTAFWDDRNGKFFNSIVFKKHVHNGDCEIVINADWGFEDCYPADLQSLYAQLFAIASKRKNSTSVKSKRVEDFSITYGDLTDDEEFQSQNSRVIAKYSLRNIGYVRHGRVRLI